jgi:glycosyltransferase involved in cell wall biosynthesis
MTDVLTTSDSAVDLPLAGPDTVSSDRPLRIAMVAPPWYELPPSGYGGIESVVADLVGQLALRGHEVTLIGAGRHLAGASRFVAVYPEPPTDQLGTPVPEVFHAAATGAILRDMDVDVVHDHSLAGPLLARGRHTPTVITMHGPVDEDLGDYVHHLGRTVDVVAISHAQRTLRPGLNWAGTVHNAVDVSSFPFRERKDDYVLWIGRFNPKKGTHLAIDAARAVGRRVVLAGKLNEPLEREYFDSAIAPRLGPDVEYVGEADAATKRELYAGATCLAFPISWEEPFGMVMVEAMACGTPVVATRRGSVPEVVEDGVSGFVVDDIRDFAAAVERAPELSPRRCREHAERHFDLPVMAAGYEQVYQMLTERADLVGGLPEDLVGNLLDVPAAGSRASRHLV